MNQRHHWIVSYVREGREFGGIGLWAATEEEAKELAAQDLAAHPFPGTSVGEAIAPLWGIELIDQALAANLIKLADAPAQVHGMDCNGHSEGHREEWTSAEPLLRLKALWKTLPMREKYRIAEQVESSGDPQ